MALLVHGLLERVLGHGKLITKLLIDPFVNGLRLVVNNDRSTSSSWSLLSVACAALPCSGKVAWQWLAAWQSQFKVLWEWQCSITAVGGSSIVSGQVRHSSTVFDNHSQAIFAAWNSHHWTPFSSAFSWFLTSAISHLQKRGLTLNLGWCLQCGLAWTSCASTCSRAGFFAKIRRLLDRYRAGSALGWWCSLKKGSISLEHTLMTEI